MSKNPDSGGSHAPVVKTPGGVPLVEQASIDFVISFPTGTGCVVQNNYLKTSASVGIASVAQDSLFVRFLYAPFRVIWRSKNHLPNRQKSTTATAPTTRCFVSDPDGGRRGLLW